MVYLLWLLLISGGPKRHVAVKVYPTISMAPAVIRVTVTVDPLEDQRVLLVEADGDTYFRSTEIPLDGDHSPKTFYIHWRDLPAADYRLTARVATQSGVVATAAQTFMVKGRFEE